MHKYLPLDLDLYLYLTCTLLIPRWEIHDDQSYTFNDHYFVEIGFQFDIKEKKMPSNVERD